MNALRKLDEALLFCEKAVALALFSGLVILIAFNVLSRNIFQVSYQHILELSPTLVVWMTCIGATIGLKRDRHIKMEFFLRYCSGRIRMAARIAVDIFGAAVMTVLCIAAMEFVRNEAAIFGSRGWLTAIFPVFFALAAFRYCTDIVFRFNGQGQSVNDSEEQQTTKPGRS
ncbi:MAG: TRAP transporter small permease [Thermodesulfobacteriota bacterium]